MRTHAYTHTYINYRGDILKTRGKTEIVRDEVTKYVIMFTSEI